MSPRPWTSAFTRPAPAQRDPDPSLSLAWDGGHPAGLPSPEPARWQERAARNPRKPPPPGVLTRWLP